MPYDKVDEMFCAETKLTAQEAQRIGLVDHIAGGLSNRQQSAARYHNQEYIPQSMTRAPKLRPAVAAALDKFKGLAQKAIDADRQFDYETWHVYSRLARTAAAELREIDPDSFSRLQIF